MNDVVLVVLVLWCVYVSDSLWWTTERSLVLVGERLGSFKGQYGPSMPVKDGGGFFVPPIVPPFKKCFELRLSESAAVGGASQKPAATDASIDKAVALATPLHRLGAGLWLYLFVAAPPVALFFGLSRTWPWLLIVLLVWLAAIVGTYRRSWRRLHGEKRAGWGGTALLMFLSPPGAIRAGDRFTRAALQGSSPVRVARGLTSDQEFHRLARLIYFDATLDNECEAKRDIEQALGAEHLTRVLNAEPTAEAGMKGFCPRCHGQVFRDSGDCPDCYGIAIRPFSARAIIA